MVEGVAGGVISLDPLITYSRGGKVAPYGLPSAYPELFRNRRAVHFFGSPWSIEGREAAYLGGLKKLQSGLGSDNLLVFLANDDYEASLVSASGVPSFVGSHLMFTDENTFKPMLSPAGARTFDAVYNARPIQFKRHELAVGIDSLMLIYFEFNDEDREQFPRLKQLLPNAYFANREVSGHEWHWFGSDKVAELLSCCRVGLCLSAKEGAMRVAMEYLLCGLSVVATKSVGGRDRYLMPPYAAIVDDNPEAVARGVSEMLERNVPKAAVRDNIGRVLNFERHAFLETVNRIAHRHFDRDDFVVPIEPFIKFGNLYRPLSETIAPLATLTPTVAPAAAPTVALYAAPKQKKLAFVLGSARSGSHLLRSFLYQEKSIRALGEVFNQDLARRAPMNFNDFLISYLKDHPDWRMSDKEADTILSGYFQWIVRETDQPNVVIDVRNGQLGILDWPPLPYAGPSRLLQFIAQPDHPIILLIREDKLSQYASLVLAHRTGQWSQGRGAVTAPKSLRLDPDKVLDALKAVEASEAMLNQWIVGHPRTARINYETMLDGDRLSLAARRDIGEVLGVKLSPDAAAGTAKLAPPLREFVENLDEILERLDGTPYSWLRLLHGTR